MEGPVQKEEFRGSEAAITSEAGGRAQTEREKQMNPIRPGGHPCHALAFHKALTQQVASQVNNA